MAEHCLCGTLHFSALSGDTDTSAHLRFKQAQPKECYSPKVEDGVENQFFTSLTQFQFEHFELPTTQRFDLISRLRARPQYQISAISYETLKPIKKNSMFLASLENSRWSKSLQKIKILQLGTNLSIFNRSGVAGLFHEHLHN